MSLPPVGTSYSQSTTVPNTPEPLSINEDNEENPSGDFARLVPISRSARYAFHNLVLAMEEYPRKYEWHRRFVHVRPNLDEMEAELDEQSTSDELAPSPKPQSPSMVHTGFWRLNMHLHPINRKYGWVVGKGRWNTRRDYLDTATAGGIDILLTSNIKEPPLHGRHARLVHSLESYTFMVAADKTLRVGDRHLNPTHISVFGQRKTVIAFGDLEYELVFTNLDQSIYKAQLNQLSQYLEHQGSQTRNFLDPTPADTDYLVMGKYYIRSSFTQGTTCWMCTAVNRDTGSFVAVKKIIAISSRMLEHARRELNAMKKLLSSHPPLSVAKVIDSLFIEPSNISGATECFIMSQPLIIGTLGKLLKSPSLPKSSRLSLFEQMLEGLAFLHKERCMHRDIKPENILASESPLQAVIIDFGCATWDRTSTNHMKGTISYLAPEIIALKQNIAPPNTTYDISADVWSMGLTAYELMRGSRVRFERITRKFYDEELLPTIVTSRTQLTDNSGKWASDVIREMLHWNPKKRIQAEQAYQRCPRYQTEREQRQLQPGKREHSD